MKRKFSKMEANLIESMNEKLKIVENTKENTKENLKEKIRQDLETILEKWCRSFTEDYNGGKMRSERGEDIEIFVRNVINEIGKQLNLNLRAVKGDLDKKDLILHTQDTTVTKHHQVDVHIYLDNRFIAVIECKSYLDSCYYTRACEDFRLFKKFGYGLKHYVFTLENSIDDDTHFFIDHVTDNICNGVFYILDGKRSSSKPIYNPYFKKTINRERLSLFIDAIYDLRLS